MTSKKFILKALVLLALGAALIFGACETEADTDVPLTPAVLYGRWLYDDMSEYNHNHSTFVISANRLRHEFIETYNNGNGTYTKGYYEQTINSWEEAVNTGASKGTYPAGYAITGTVTAASVSASKLVGVIITDTFYLSNDRNAFAYYLLVDYGQGEFYEEEVYVRQ
jgi:hypothetical protein